MSKSRMSPTMQYVLKNKVDKHRPISKMTPAPFYLDETVQGIKRNKCIEIIFLQ